MQRRALLPLRSFRRRRWVGLRLCVPDAALKLRNRHRRRHLAAFRCYAHHLPPIAVRLHFTTLQHSTKTPPHRPLSSSYLLSIYQRTQHLTDRYPKRIPACEVLCQKGGLSVMPLKTILYITRTAIKHRGNRRSSFYCNFSRTNQVSTLTFRMIKGISTFITTVFR